MKLELPYKNQKPRPIITVPSPEQHIIANKAPILNVLIQMKNDNKADSTINFTRKALTFLSKNTSLSEPEAVKALIETTRRLCGQILMLVQWVSTLIFTTHATERRFSSPALYFLVPSLGWLDFELLCLCRKVFCTTSPSV